MKKILKKIFRSIGPGFVTGAADDDPAGIGTYSQTGALFGYNQLWTALFSVPFMTIIQEMCGRIGMVTGKGLAVIIKSHYSRLVLYFAVILLFVANVVNIGADLGAMASSAQLLLGIPFLVWLLFFTITIVILEVFVPYPAYAKILKYLAISLLAYVITAFTVRQNWSNIGSSVIMPKFSLDKNYLMNIVAIFGTTISPYLFFWQADEEVEEEVSKGRLKMMGKGIPRIHNRDIREMRVDTTVGMIFSNLVMFFIMVTTASTLHARNIVNIETANQAAEALRPFAGDFAFILFAAGIISTGLLAVPILAGSASYAIAETLNWREGLYLKFKRAHGFYGVITIATLFGLFVNLTPIKPFQLLYYSAVLNGFCAPPLMVLILLIGKNKKIMGDHTNPWISNVLGWIITAFMFFSGVALLLNLLKVV